MRSAILSLTVALAFAGTASAEKLQETFDRTVDVRSGPAISLENVNGRIVINSWDQPRVRIHAIRKAESREALDKLIIDVRGGGDNLSIISRMPNKGEGFLDFLFGNGGNASIEYESRCRARRISRSRTRMARSRRRMSAGTSSSGRRTDASKRSVAPERSTHRRRTARSAPSFFRSRQARRWSSRRRTAASPSPFRRRLPRPSTPTRRMARSGPICR